MGRCCWSVSGICVKGLTLAMATLGILPGLFYLLVFTIPHSVWVQAIFFPTHDDISYDMKRPGINFFNWLTASDGGHLSVKSSRIEVCEAVVASLAHLMTVYGFAHDSDFWYDVFRPLAILIVILIDVIVILGILTNILLIVSYISSNPKVAR